MRGSELVRRASAAELSFCSVVWAVAGRGEGGRGEQQREDGEDGQGGRGDGGGRNSRRNRYARGDGRGSRRRLRSRDGVRSWRHPVAGGEGYFRHGSAEGGRGEGRGGHPSRTAGRLSVLRGDSSGAWGEVRC